MAVSPKVAIDSISCRRKKMGIVADHSKKPSDSDALLQPARTGFFGKKKGKPRSDDHKGVALEEYQAPTPPASPDPEGDDSPLHVTVVTPDRRGKALQDDDSTYSDLTDQRTEKLRRAFHVQDPPATKSSSSVESPKEVLKNTLRSREDNRMLCQQDPPSFLNQVLGAMDKACYTTTKDDQGRVTQTLSFAPEWGMAPDDSEDEDDFLRPAQASIGTNTRDEEEDDDSSFVTYEKTASKTASRTVESRSTSPTPMTPPHPPSSRSRPISPGSVASSQHYENFEMVLEEKETMMEPSDKKKRSWRPLQRLLGNNKPSKEDPPKNLGIAPRESTLDQDITPPRRNNREVPKQEVPKSSPIELPPPKAEPREQVVEEEKKDEDMFDEPAENEEDIDEVTSSSDTSSKSSGKSRRRRLKRLFSKKPTPTESDKALATINEEADNESAEGDEPTPGPELKVLVPGSADKYLGHGDLIGDEVILQEAAVAPPANPKPVAVPKPVSVKSAAAARVEPTKSAAARVESKSTVQKTPAKKLSPEVETIAPSPQPIVRKVTSWKERIAFRKKSSKSENPAIAACKSEDVSSQEKPAKLAKSLDPPKESKKPVWKEAVDESTGRVYYYHRLTRKTTWTKPPAEELLGYNPAKIEAVMSLDEGEASYKNEEEDSIRKKTVRDFDPDVWKLKQEIMGILKTMAPPDGTSVDRLMLQYDGREHELLKQLKDLKESRPFDEPLEPKKPKTVPPIAKDVAPIGVPVANPVRSRVQTGASMKSGMSLKSGLSGKSRISDRTQQIRNTGPRSPGRTIESIAEDMSHATSISSHHDDHLPPVGTSSDVASQKPPSHIPVPRSRELMVEEFSTESYKAKETYDMKGVIRGRRMAAVKAAAEQKLKKNKSRTARLGGIEEDESDTLSELASVPGDSISALSMTDGESSFRNDADMARRRALDDAISREDWDLAAALSEGMRNIKTQAAPKKRSKTEWKQTELDKYISNSDWDAVANYIAKVRAKAQQPEESDPYDESDQRSESEGSNPRKRFGARSQLQHEDLNSAPSVSSWTSSSYESEYSSESSSSEEKYRLPLGRRSKEFAC